MFPHHLLLSPLPPWHHAAAAGNRQGIAATSQEGLTAALNLQQHLKTVIINNVIANSKLILNQELFFMKLPNFPLSENPDRIPSNFNY